MPRKFPAATRADLQEDELLPAHGRTEGCPTATAYYDPSSNKIVTCAVPPRSAADTCRSHCRGALTGGSGLALGGKGALDLKRANDRIKGSHLYSRLRREASEQAVAETNDLFEKWRLEQETALTTTVVRFVDFLRRHARQVKDNER